MADRVLYLIDDDDSVRVATTLLLEVGGYSVSSFASAEAFLQSVPSPEGLVLADVRLPGMSGLQLLRDLKAQKCQASIVLMSAHADAALRDDSIDAGAESLLQKPVDPSELLAIVKQYFGIATPDAGSVGS